MSSPKLTIVSPAFKSGSPIPKKYTGDGPDISPPLNWDGIPDGTKSLALISDDPDAPVGTWVHWVIFNIPPTEKGLPEGVPKQNTLANGARQGTSDFRKVGYNGPAPPPGKPHRYYFKLYALNTMLDLPAGAKKSDLLKAMEGHILAQAEYMGTYQR
ncbi:MAG TPA: YbhB/YbcL family Raf kinase inhibitor-like protein [Candidatus Hydrogenedens sp.]|nr:YbhB/YbcL family Raf kinase inhibitor-like protein [Candidatus Hydrogenedens sp.]